MLNEPGPSRVGQWWPVQGENWRLLSAEQWRYYPSVSVLVPRTLPTVTITGVGRKLTL